MPDTPVRVTVTDGTATTHGTALAYFHDSLGRPLAVVELDPDGKPGPLVQIFSQFDVREDRPAD